MLTLYPSVLLVEDDDIDAEAVIRAFKFHHVPYPLLHMVDGLEALDVLRKRHRQTLTHPYLILLDLNMPRMGGLEFLKTIRQDAYLKGSIVFVMTTSNREEDLTAAYKYNVAGYILKEKVVNFGELIQLLVHYQTLIQWPIA